MSSRPTNEPSLTDAAAAQWKQYQEFAERWRAEHPEWQQPPQAGDHSGGTCPNCGYCAHCGRGGYGMRPYGPYVVWTDVTWKGNS